MVAGKNFLRQDLIYKSTGGTWDDEARRPRKKKSAGMTCPIVRNCNLGGLVVRSKAVRKAAFLLPIVGAPDGSYNHLGRRVFQIGENEGKQGRERGPEPSDRDCAKYIGRIWDPG